MTPFRVARPATIVVIAIVLTGCTARVNVDVHPEASVGSYRTYAWLPGPRPPPGRAVLVARHVGTTADEVLRSKGYRRVSPGQADFLLNYHAILEQQVDVRARRGPYGRTWAGSSVVRTYVVGTLIIDVIDRADERLVWTGMVEGAIRNPEQGPAKIDRVVENILRHFPSAR